MGGTYRRRSRRRYDALLTGRLSGLVPRGRRRGRLCPFPSARRRAARTISIAVPVPCRASRSEVRCARHPSRTTPRSTAPCAGPCSCWPRVLAHGGRAAGRRHRAGPRRRRRPNRTRQVQTRSRPSSCSSRHRQRHARPARTSARSATSAGSASSAPTPPPATATPTRPRPTATRAPSAPGCVGDSRGFLQGQCTSWVAYRLAMRNGLSFSNWYAGRHWGNASEWGKVAKGIGHKPDKTPAIGVDRLVQARPRLLRRGRLQQRHHPDLRDEHRRPQRLPLRHGQPRHEQLPRQVHPPRRRRPGRHHSADRADRRTSVRPPRADRHHLAGVERCLRRRGLPRVSATACLLATVRGTSYRDGNPPDRTRPPSTPWSPSTRSGHVSSPGRVDGAARDRDRPTAPGSTTSAGPALCGRTGHERRQRLGCRLLVDGGWRAVELHRTTSWGEPSTPGVPAQPRRQRVLLPRDRPQASGPVVHGARPRRRAPGAPTGRRAAYPAARRRRHLGDHAQRARALRADRLGTPAHRDLLGARPRPAGTRSTTHRRVPWGSEDGRAFLAAQRRLDRLLPLADRGPDAPAPARRAPTSTRSRMTWGADRVSGRLPAGAPAYPTWVAVVRRTRRLLVAVGRAPRRLPGADARRAGGPSALPKQGQGRAPPGPARS